MSDTLQKLATEAGLLIDWTDYRGRPTRVEPDVQRTVLGRLGLPAESPADAADSLALLRWKRETQVSALYTTVAGRALPLPPAIGAPGARYRAQDERGVVFESELAGAGGDVFLPALETPGYYRVEIDDCNFTLAVAPGRCFGVDDLRAAAHHPRNSHPLWGTVVQLYGLRSRGDGGLGHFRALGDAAQALAASAASAVAISPVHAGFAADPGHFSPYSPSSRQFLNPFHIDPWQVDPAADQVLHALGAESLAAELEGADEVRWSQAAALRIRVLRELYARHPAREGEPAADFQRYCEEGGEALHRHATFEALHARFLQQDQRDWRRWPKEFATPDAAGIAGFAESHGGEVRWHQWLQWQAARGLAAAQSKACTAGMPIGLIADLAVGSHPDGSDAWRFPAQMLSDLEIGAPPDRLAPDGQAWGLCPLSPQAMPEHGFSAWLSMLRASMVHAGGVRIDHAIGLQRMWLLPRGGRAADGAYVKYPLHDLLRLLALESWRHRCVVIGEDLGTVTQELRDALAEAGLLGMSVLPFEGDHEGFLPTARWRRGAVAMTSTHDIATLAGWWQGHDLELREGVAGAGTESSMAAREEREGHRPALWRRMVEDSNGQLPADPPPIAHTDVFVDAAIDHVRRVGAPLTLIPLEDLIGTHLQPNLPGTVDEHPNWRRRLPQPVDSLIRRPEVAARLQRLAHEADCGNAR